MMKKFRRIIVKKKTFLNLLQIQLRKKFFSIFIADFLNFCKKDIFIFIFLFIYLLYDYIFIIFIT